MYHKGITSATKRSTY